MKILSNEEIKKELDKILTYGANDIIIDTEDINKITNNKDLLVMSASEQYGFNSALKAIKSTVSDFEENKLSLIEADSVLVHFQVNSDYNIINFAEAMEVIHNTWMHIYMMEKPDVIFGVSSDNNFRDDYVKASVFISYSKKENLKCANNFIEVSSI